MRNLQINFRYFIIKIHIFSGLHIIWLDRVGFIGNFDGFNKTKNMVKEKESEPELNQHDIVRR